MRQRTAVGAVFAARVGQVAANFPVGGEFPFDFGFATDAVGIDIADVEHHAALFHQNKVVDAAAEYGHGCLYVFVFPNNARIDLAVLFGAYGFVF